MPDKKGQTIHRRQRSTTSAVPGFHRIETDGDKAWKQRGAAAITTAVV